MADEVLRHLYLGFIRLHVLYHAGKEPICGAELMEELEHHGYDIGPGTLYPVLHQMQQGGLLTSEDEVVDGKRRKNLTITPAGRKLLAKAREQLKELASEILDDKDARAMRKQK
jgi:PadR family transcriptional regulator, regulatory protein PadR